MEPTDEQLQAIHDALFRVDMDPDLPPTDAMLDEAFDGGEWRDHRKD